MNLRNPRSLALAALGLGVSADLLFYRRMPGISIPLFLGLCLAALYAFSRAEGRPPTGANRWLGPAALLFAALTVVRAEPTLLFLNAGAALLLLLLHVGLFRGPALASLPGFYYPFKALLATFEISLRPGPLAAWSAQALVPRGARLRQLIPVGRGLALAAPIVGVFTILLMMADGVFAGYIVRMLSLQFPFRIDDLLGHALTAAVFAWGSAGALLTALPADPEPADAAPLTLEWRLGCVEGLTVLVCVETLFAGFMAVQAAYLFGGLDTLAQSGMTYADYARRGFFELVAVATLTLGMLILLASLTRRDQQWQAPAFNGASAMLILLTLGLLGSAFQRMWLYEQAYGFTHLRLYTHTFMIWLAVVLALFLAALLAGKPRWFSFGSFVAALAVLAVLTLADPEAIIVRANVARYQQTGELAVGGEDEVESEHGRYQPSRALDTFYLAQLSPDATPALVELLPLLDAQARAEVRAGLEGQREQLEQVAQHGWPAWHLARMRALAAIQSLPPE
jgi:hypothetical protein